MSNNKEEIVAGTVDAATEIDMSDPGIRATTMTAALAAASVAVGSPPSVAGAGTYALTQLAKRLIGI